MMCCYNPSNKVTDWTQKNQIFILHNGMCQIIHHVTHLALTGELLPFLFQIISRGYENVCPFLCDLSTTNEGMVIYTLQWRQ